MEIQDIIKTFNPQNMTFIEAAIKILSDNGNQPLSAKEIWDRISERNLVKTNGKTPWASLNTIMIYRSQSKYNKDLYFDVVSNKPMKFILKNLNIINVDVDENEESNIYEKIGLCSITSCDLNWKKLTIYNNNNNIEYELSDCEEYTYIIEDKAHATIKIGRTKNNPEIRFNQLKTANPSINLLHVFPSDQFSEKDLHDKFDDFKKDLEWFFFAKSLREFITNEIKKHKKVILTYSTKVELEKGEEEMLEMLG